MTFYEFEQIYRSLLLNFSLILLPLFIYESFVLDKVGPGKRGNSIDITILSSITVILCMTFPVSLFNGHIFDLRLIPVLISLLYGSLASGIITIIVMFIYRFHINGDGIFTMFVVSTFVIMISLYLAPRFRLLTGKKRVFIVLNIIFFAMLLMFFSTYLINLSKEEFSRNFLLKFFASYTVIKMLTTYITFNLLEGFIEKRELRVELQRADRLNTVGELAASIAHEVRNPLTVSKGFLQLIQTRGLSLGEEKINEYVTTSIQEIERSESVISDFLSFAKPNVEKIEFVNVSDLILSVCKVMYSYAAMNDVIISQELSDGCFLYTDRNKFTQIFVNIVKNSIEAMEQGGHVDVRVLKENDQIIIEIEDYGIGMTKEEMSKLGTPFYTLKNSGTGLGLMLSYKYIEVLGGKMRIDSEKGKGTRVTVTFFNNRKSVKEMV